ncbi:MAG: 3-dehydroquinate synthase, partial [Pseudomonadota bacterium]|nr:3-dehydroquinate synthase [Pseudomonadota bacterium]
FEGDALEFVILESCRHKAQVVANDEREAGERALLNLGHTFGHAIEAATGYGNWLHGEAVAVGMMMAATMSQKMGWLDPEEPGRIRELLGRANLPVKVPDGMSALDFLKHMAVDKKVSHGRIRLVLLKEIGDAILISDYPDGMLDEVLAEFTG